MPADIRKHSLLVVSDTPACKATNGVMVYEPVLREMKAMLQLFDEIIWLASDKGDGKHVLQLCNDPRIKVVVMPSVYHKQANWFHNIVNYPVFLFHILKHIRKVKYVHSRGPSHPAFITILFSLLDCKRKYWHKYAGNWGSADVPHMYRLQKYLLGKTNSDSAVTINGKWNLPAGNIYSFENPCFTNEELQVALKIAGAKKFDKDLSLLFVGNLYTAKGIMKLLDALQTIEQGSRFTKCYIAGDGPLYDDVLKLAQGMKNIEVVATGALDRAALNEYYAQSHFLILPSESEGFPKVIAEAAAYGCIPIVPNLSAIPQYIQTGVNGYLLPDTTPATIIKTITDLQRMDMQRISNNVTTICHRFTYEYYINRIKTEVYKLPAN